jgi:hypothetical protein
LRWLNKGFYLFTHLLTANTFLCYSPNCFFMSWFVNSHTASSAVWYLCYTVTSWIWTRFFKVDVLLLPPLCEFFWLFDFRVDMFVVANDDVGVDSSTFTDGWKLLFSGLLDERVGGIGGILCFLVIDPHLFIVSWHWYSSWGGCLWWWWWLWCLILFEFIIVWWLGSCKWCRVGECGYKGKWKKIS